MSMRIAALLLAVVALGRPCSAAEEAPLRIGIDGRVRTLDPHEATGSMELQVAEACFEGLTFIDPETLRPAPGVAASWTVSADRLHWTFTLREEARWSDGRPVTATDFARSFRRSLHPALDSAWAFILHSIAGVRAYNAHGHAAEAIARTLHDRSFVQHLRAFATAHPKGVDRATWRAWPWSSALPDALATATEPLAREAWLGRRAQWSARDLETLATSLTAAAQRLRQSASAAKTAFGVTRGIIPVSERVLRIELEEPEPFLLQFLAMPCAAPVPPEVYAAPPRPPTTRPTKAARKTRWWEASDVVVNGPYKPVEFRASRTPGVRLEANPKYWNAGAIRQARIDVMTVKDPKAGLQQFVEGALDWSQSWPFEMVRALRKADTFRLCESQTVYYYLFQCEHPGLTDPRVRRALAQAIDREALLGKVLRGFGRPAETLVPAALPGYGGPSAGLPFAPERARALLASAGHAAGKGLPEIVLLFNAHQQHRAVAEFVAAAWREKLGLRVSLRRETWPRYLEARRTGDYAVARMGWIGDYADPLSFLALFESDDPGNVGQWSNAAFDGLLAKARAEPDMAKRLGHLAEAERVLLIEGTPCAPLYWYQTGDLVQPWVRGFRTQAEPTTPPGPRVHNVQGLHPFRGLWVERPK